MALSGVRYRFKDLGDGKKQRLAFRGSRVIEAKSYEDGKSTGAIHTPAEFKRDAKRLSRFRATRERG